MSTARAFLGLSHTPLMGLNPIDPAVQREVDAALSAVREAVLGWAPELVVLIGPDHYNGFFNALMPPFCIGDDAVAVGDYLTPAGRLNVDGRTAIALATHLMDADFDVAVSRRMRVDHGFSQALQIVWGGLDTPPIVPIFMNAVAQPGIPRLRRCRAFGAAIGRFLDGETRRTLVIGSGGLSHEPPVPTLEHPDPAVRERITVPREASESERDAKTRRVMAAGVALASGEAGMKPLNPDWDRRWMDALADGRLGALTDLDESGITRDAGLSAHESKTWLIARAALGDAAADPAQDRVPPPLPCPVRWYRAIPEWIAGYGAMFMHTGDPR